MSKYKMLVNILDRIRDEAPDDYKKYHPSLDKVEEINYARSLAFVHLYLKASYDLSSFMEREKYITDGTKDGGIDAYYIDKGNKIVYFIQAKFRTTEDNFNAKEITIDEMLKMDVNRMIDGDREDEEGNDYNGKIQQMIDRINKIEDIARYKYEGVILANLRKYKTSDISRLVGLPTRVFDVEKIYEELLFPILIGSCHQASEIIITLPLAKKENSGQFQNVIKTKYSECNVMVVFIPVIEIAKIMSIYKNSILKYNPRSYLGLKRGSVNTMIESTIIENETNEFALFNNGLTLLSDGTEFNSRVGVKEMGQLIVTNPQIINGGQTANTLAHIYETTKNENLFKNKEVLVKIITFVDEDRTLCEKSKLELIEELSKATNLQSLISEADRHANDRIQIEFQKKIFKDFGYCYNRKEGEFYDGIEKSYVDKKKIIDRSVFLRIATAIKGDVSKARRNSDKVLFGSKHLNDVYDNEHRYRLFMYGFFVYAQLVRLEKELKSTGDRYGTKIYGNSLRYGKYAVIYVVSKSYKDSWELEEYQNEAKKNMYYALSKWKEFEEYVSERYENNDYFVTYRNSKNEIYREYNFDNYYKGRTINQNIKEFGFYDDKMTVM